MNTITIWFVSMSSTVPSCIGSENRVEKFVECERKQLNVVKV